MLLQRLTEGVNAAVACRPSPLRVAVRRWLFFLPASQPRSTLDWLYVFTMLH